MHSNLKNFYHWENIWFFSLTWYQLMHSFFFFSIFSPIIFISWKLITFQYCSSSYHTLTWISHGFTCVSHLESSSHLPPLPIPLGHPSAPALSTCLICIAFKLLFFYIKPGFRAVFKFANNISLVCVWRCFLF